MKFTHKFIESFGYGSASTGMTAVALTIVLLGTGLLSGFVDNLPIVAALVPVVKNLHSLGLPHANILWWALLFGGCFGGNLTMIGSTANLVAVGLYEKETGHSIGFLTWMKSGVIVTFITLILALLLLLVQIGISL